MPIYEYACTSCHHHFDLLQKITEEPIKSCPNCTAATVVRLVSAAGFQLKGSGWYQTDFKNKTENKPSSAVKQKVTEQKTTESTTASSTKGDVN